MVKMRRVSRKYHGVVGAVSSRKLGRQGSCLGLQLSQAMSIRIDHQLKAIGDPQLGKDRGQVMAHRGFGDTQAISDPLILVSLPYQGDDLALAWGQRGDFMSFRIDRLDLPALGDLA